MNPVDTKARPRTDRAWRLSAIACAAGLAAAPGQAADLDYLRSLLDATPQGGWVQVNLNKFSDAWATPAQGGLPSGSYSNPATVVTAWSSVAWDSARGNLLLWGGGHANYMGNEMYVFQGSSGTWTRGSLPSRLEQYGNTATFFTVDDAAPQSAHTYDNSVYVKANDMFVTFGGAAFNTGSGFTVRGPNGAPTAAGPWMWDPTKADANKVGGTTGSGYLPTTEGGNMWTNQRNQWTGNGPGPSFLETNSAYRMENGKDVIYVTTDANASGFQSLYRYELGDIRAGEQGKFQQVGVSYYAPNYQSAGTIDTHNDLYIRTSATGNFHGLGVWDLSVLPADAGGSSVDCTFTFNQQSDRCLFDRYIKLVDENGVEFAVNPQHGMAFDNATGKLLLWDGKDRGTLWETEAEYVNGVLSDTWQVRKLTSATAAQPEGDFSTPSYEIGVLGKWQYVDELGAFIALDNFDTATQDAGVWLYKPTMVPEPGTYALMLGGLAAVGWLSVRRRRSA